MSDETSEDAALVAIAIDEVAASIDGLFDGGLPSTRDLFAVAALHALLSKAPTVSAADSKAGEVARLSYRIADAMMSQRDQEPESGR